MDKTSSGNNRKKPALEYRHAVASDVVLFTIQENCLKTLLVRRALGPFKGCWSLPGGFVNSNESVDEAALRTLQDETGISKVYLEQLYTFGDMDRDPRGRVISVSYYAVVDWEQFNLTARTHISSTRWFSLKALPQVAFDHRQIIMHALERLRNKVNYTSVGFQLLPRTFSLSQLQKAYEVILDRPLDKRNFRKKMSQLGILREAGKRKLKGQRPSKLYEFTKTRVIKLQEKGIIVPF